jgi:hypothetical protein
VPLLLLRVRPWLRALRALLLGLALAFLALATARLFLSFTKSLHLGDELGLPSSEVSLNAAVLAFDHITITLPSSEHTVSTEHPEPLVNVFANLQEKRDR